MADGSKKLRVQEEVVEAFESNLGPLAKEDSREINNGKALTRRMFTKVLGFLGISVLANQIAGGKIFEGLFGAEGEYSKEMGEKIDHKAREIANKIEAEEDLDENAKIMKTIDYLGTALFAWGVRDLLPRHKMVPGGHGHIHQWHYGVLAALSALKYQYSNEEQRHHLRDETISNAKAFGIISGTIVAAEGLNLDIEKAYEIETGKKPDKKDQVALMTLLASALSPLATTVGSAGIISKMSNKFCDGDKKLMALCVSHISNLSGFLLFGDPPFIAVCEKYGFKQGIEWQMKTMWPLAIFSLFSSTYRINKVLALNNGLNKADAHKKALEDTKSGLIQNIPVLVKMAMVSLQNAAKYFSGADISSKFAQDPRGIEVKIGEILEKRVANLANLAVSEDFDKSHHEDHEGLIREDVPETEYIVEELAADLEIADGQAAMHADFKIPDTMFFAQMLKGYDQAVNSDSEPSAKGKSVWEKLTDVHRIKESLGHNLGDVVNVFPFQAGCVPFLVPVFKDLVDKLEGVDENLKEVILFLLIMVFSMIADNYVACKIGLQVFPEKPQVSLIAAIQGGSMTAIGNMANVAQFSLDKFSLVDSLQNIGVHATPALVSLGYSKLVTILSDLGFVNVPTLVDSKEPDKKGSPKNPQQTREMTRRELFSSWRKNA